LRADNTAVLFVDHQEGLILGVHDQDQQVVRRNVFGLARTADLYGLPAVLTTSADDGPNGPIFAELPEQLPGAPFIHRRGEVDAFDDTRFAEAVEATGRKNLVIAGILTEVCLAFASLSAVSRGYTVHAVIDASGASSHYAATAAIERMAAAGITIQSTGAVVAELLADWRTPQGAGVGSILAEQAIPFYRSAIALKMPGAASAGEPVPEDAEVVGP